LSGRWVLDQAVFKTVQRRTPALRHRGRSALACLCILMTLAATPMSLIGQGSAAEYQVKAAFLFHFAQLVDWPPDAFGPAGQSISLCLFDDEPERQEFQETVEGKSLGDRTLHVRLLHDQQDLQGCNILFLSLDEARRQHAVLSSTQGQPVLTIGETDTFLKDGGMIRFHLEGDRVRFDINLPASESSKLKISSRLLLLASQVLRGSAAGSGGR